jgi:hypothetical protein
LQFFLLVLAATGGLIKQCFYPFRGSINRASQKGMARQCPLVFVAHAHQGLPPLFAVARVLIAFKGLTYLHADREDAAVEARFVNDVRLILFWPMSVQASPALAGGMEALARSLGGAGNKWQEQHDLFQWMEGASDQVHYAEMAYFHPFMRQFLYGVSDAGQAGLDRSMRLFRSTQVSGLEVALASDKHPLVLRVERLHLYLFDVGLVVLVLEVASSERLDLASVQDLLDQLRRLYPPYWGETDEGGHTPLRGGHCPWCVRLVDENGNPIGPKGTFHDPGEYLPLAKSQRLFQPAAHWAELIAPLQVAPKDRASGLAEVTRVAHLGDDRLPFMAWLAMDDPKQLTPGDWVRLAFGDEHGDHLSYPYSRHALADFEKNHCFDLFWGREGDPDWMTTRYLVSGFGFVAVGKDDRGERQPFFTDPRSGGLAHFRHHYFLLGLIAHLQRAVLLDFSQQMAREVQTYKPTDPVKRRALRGRIRGLLARHLDFTERYWWLEVCNQEQGKELFDLWTRHLDTARLYQQVDRELEAMNTFLQAEEQQEQTRDQGVLTWVATAGLFLGVLVGLLGMNIFDAHAPDAASGSLVEMVRYRWSVDWVALLAIFVGVLGALVGMAFLFRWVYKAWLARKRTS